MEALRQIREVIVDMEALSQEVQGCRSARGSGFDPTPVRAALLRAEGQIESLGLSELGSAAAGLRSLREEGAAHARLPNSGSAMVQLDRWFDTCLDELGVCTEALQQAERRVEKRTVR